MQKFTSVTQVQHARLPPEIRKAVFRAVLTLIEVYRDYDPDDDGFVVVVDRNTTDDHALALLGRPWTEAILEGVTYDPEARIFETCHLFNNHAGVTILVPDRPWLNAAFRSRLVSELDDRSVSSLNREESSCRY